MNVYMELLLHHKDFFLILLLFFLVICSAFFAASETSMMALNRYRLHHLVNQGNPIAKRISHLLERPDRLLGVILLGGTFSNIIAAALATVIAIDLFGEVAVFPATLGIAFIELILGEITPKTVGAFYPEKIAFASSGILSVLHKVLYPFVWVANGIAKGVLLLFNIKITKRTLDVLTNEEIRTMVHQANGRLNMSYRRIMLGVLDLSELTVDDIKVPRNNIVGIDLDDDWPTILNVLSQTDHTRLPLYRESMDYVQGIVHLRKVMNLAAQGKLDKDTLISTAEEVYFIPETTPLNVQLLNFRHEKHRIGLVVNEYGDIQGLVTLEGILEEIVGEFTTGLSTAYKRIQKEYDGSFLVDGSISIRELNRRLAMELPIEGPKTLNGLIIEYLEKIPLQGVCLRIEDHPIEVIQVEENLAKLVRIWPKVS